VGADGCPRPPGSPADEAGRAGAATHSANKRHRLTPSREQGSDRNIVYRNKVKKLSDSVSGRRSEKAMQQVTAAIVAMGLAIGGFLAGGRYAISTVARNDGFNVAERPSFALPARAT
jgi:hypothetical protein